MSKHLPNKADKYNQGFYKLNYPEKYIGNPNEPIIYRSGWEYKFMVYCDMNEKIKRWGSETFKINYVDYKGHSRYYMPDFYIEVESDKNPGFLNKFLIEIKPEKEIREPIIPEKVLSEKKIKALEYAVETWLKNKHKWAYAVSWCEARDIKFQLVTEKHLEQLKIVVPPKQK